MKSFQLEILSPERVFYRGECVSLVVPISDGMMGVMANCEPFTASMTIGEASYTPPEGEKVVFSISGGMIDVENNSAKLLCEYALLPEEIDEEIERREAEKARAELAKEQSRRDYQLSRRMLMNAVNNLKVKKKTGIN